MTAKLVRIFRFTFASWPASALHCAFFVHSLCFRNVVVPKINCDQHHDIKKHVGMQKGAFAAFGLGEGPGKPVLGFKTR